MELVEMSGSMYIYGVVSAYFEPQLIWSLFKYILFDVDFSDLLMIFEYWNAVIMEQ